MVFARLLGSEPPRPAVTDVTAIRRRLLSAHRPALERALACADAIAAHWDGDSTTDPVADEYRAALEAADALDPLVAALADAVDHAGGELAARPVADAPYLAVAGRGVVLRGPLADGGRVVATLRAFEVDPYRRGADLPAALVVETLDR